ncbi:MAG: aminotransferase class III-fold pyridoxal phosphate-dependent enzyme [Flavobacteriaceae bacterium]|nr:aminotransferase class III-fold pyridoxal phosphate-dependent enzyme [Flavobacteriaceae bacterium]
MGDNKQEHKILKEAYQLEVHKLERLMGYEIATYKVISATGNFILKKFPREKKHYAKVAHENLVLQALKGKVSCQIPEVCQTHAGEYISESENDIYRLQTFLEGNFLAELNPSESILSNLGHVLAEVDLALEKSGLPAPPSYAREWDVRHALENISLMNEVSDIPMRRLISYFLLQFKEMVMPNYYQFPTQLIHGDANDWNVLTTDKRISGLIDFGDMCYSWRINELAIALAYAVIGAEDILEAATHMISAYSKQIPLKEIEIDNLYYLIAARLCTTLCHAAKSQRADPENEYLVISQKPAQDLLKKWIRINPLKAQKVFRKASGLPLSQQPETALLEQERNTFFSQTLSLSYEQPIPMYKSALQFMYDYEGNTFLDAYNNIMLVGHSHPDLVKAGQSAMARLNTNTRYLYPELTNYADKLLQKFPKALNKVFFVNSGSAATDLALRLARSYTERKKIMVLKEGYHGNTQAAIEISHYKYSKAGSIGKPDHVVESILPNAFGLKPEMRETAASYYATLAKELIAEHEGTLGAFIAEPIVGCGGQVPLPIGYLNEVYQAIRKQGGLCISDEVQVGFGRLGSCFWGFELQGVIPDIVILGKPMGNGHPIGAVVTTAEIAKKFADGPEFFTSFGGNPVSCLIGEEVLNVIQRDSLQQHAKQVGDYFKEELKTLQKSYHSIGDIRGEGLFLGIELVDHNNLPDGKLAKHVKNFLRNNGILSSTDGPHDQVIKIKPPLCFNMENVDEFIRIFQESLAAREHN